MTTSHPYRGDEDFTKLFAFVTKTRRRWHVGDLTWRMYYSSLFMPSENVELWLTSSGEVIGFTWFYPDATVEIITDDAALLPDMLQWAIAQTRYYGTSHELFVVTEDDDAMLIPFLENRSFERGDPYSLHLQRSLEDEFTFPGLPEGFNFRASLYDNEVRARVAIHHAAFGTQNVTVEGYHRVRSAPTYHPHLDIVVTAPDGQFAAFCICWLDMVNKIGQFEPVGTHPNFQRQGLGHAIMQEGMRRMQAAGMERAIVTSALFSAASTEFYASLGFQPVNRELTYRRIIL